ncbi:MAG TPA: Holliday junction branch migration protein RuvA [Elusimicrobiota bacterium]|nr:Holliday junction branch migration protein RuvA [Elusimicrobiota bacterium]
MIASLRGSVSSRTKESVVLDVGGVGYEVYMTSSDLARLPEAGQEALVLIEESFAMYGGGPTLYGFLAPVEKAMFSTFRDQVPSTGAKKALEYLERASKSLPDFRRAVLDKDSKMLCAVFGFTKKTADKLIAALKDNMEAISVPGQARLARADGDGAPASGALSQALGALSALGYRPSEARAALEAVAGETGGRALPVEQMVRLALKKL